MASFSNARIPPYGKVQLTEKIDPIHEKQPPYDDHYIYTLAEIDTSLFKAKLESMPSEMWEDDKQEGNAKMIRPAHDRWGIKKIVFSFCDDFMLKVLDFPWSQEKEWKDLLTPIYESIGVDERRVVRSLLACMPPGVEIPIHHDTGLWVKKTHRCHVPIVSHEKVEFLVGPTPDAMQNYSLKEGSIIELNNQAKHAVKNLSPKERIHLIFDFVDEDYILPSRIALKPGELINQTRRSVDLTRPICDIEKIKIKQQSPKFIIIGAQKCGTTSMYEYICQHPLVLKGKRRETHYFDWRYNNDLPNCTLNPEAHYEYYMNFFYHENLQKHTSLSTGESTPSYLLHSDIVLPRMKAICPWVNLIVMLRNPTARAFSHYQMCIDPEGTPQQLQIRGQSNYKNRSFLDIIKSEINELTALGVTASCSYDIFRDKYLSIIKDIKHGGHSIVARGIYCLQLQTWLENWPKEQIKVFSISEIKGNNKAVRNKMYEVFEFLNLPEHDIEDFDVKNSRNYKSEMSEECKKVLNDFYEPFNQRLFKLIGKELIW